MPISEKQKQILAFGYTSYDALICDGAIRSGKTVFMTIGFVDWAMSHFNGCQFAICGKTVDSATKNIIRPYLGIRYVNWKYKIKWHRSDKILSVERGNIKNTFEVFGGKDESSFMLIQGRTFAGVLLDEVALQPQSFVDQALARCSVENSKAWFNCNPESPNHWFYKEWVLKPEKHNAYHLHFLLEDNPSLSEKKIQKYKSDFEGVFYQRYILGLWVVAEGLVYNMKESWITDEKPDPNSGEWYISMDYGTLNPCTAGLWNLRGGKAIRVKEYYYSGRESHLQKTDEEYCSDIVEFAKGYHITTVIVDPSAASFITSMRKHGFNVIQANNDVLDGIRRTLSYLEKGNIKINRCCGNSLKEFGLYRWDEKATADTVIKENDHCMDDIRYFVNTILKNRAVEPEETDAYYYNFL